MGDNRISMEPTVRVRKYVRRTKFAIALRKLIRHDRLVERIRARPPEPPPPPCPECGSYELCRSDCRVAPWNIGP